MKLNTGQKRNSISTSTHVLFCLLYKHTDEQVLDDFPEGFQRFSKFFSKATDECFCTFWNIFQR